jgi:hypothetical protein
MTIKVTYNVTDVYVTQDVSPVYINVSYSGGGSGGAAVWGGITGTLSNQTDLQTALDGKFDDPTGTTSQYLRGDGTLATFPSLTGFVPYTGATANVDLGTHRITAQNATISSSGSGDTVTLNHSSGSGIGLNITKGGSGEGLYINKTSGSGNAATIIGTLNATTLVKSGGTSSQFLKADGTVDSSVYVPTSTTLTINGVSYDLSANRSWTVAGGISGSGASGQVAYWTGTSAQAGSNNLFWDISNSRLILGGGLNTGERLQVTGTMKVTGDTLLKGSTALGGAISLTVQNSSGTNMLRVRDDGYILIGQASTSAAPTIYAFSGITGDRSLRIGIQSAGSLTPTPAFNINQESNYTYTSGTGEFTTITANFLPTSGTGTLAYLSIKGTINQTGGANGITRGLYVNPTLTAAADWRSIEWSNNSGWGLYGAGTANNYLGGNLLIGTTTNVASSILTLTSTTQGFLPPRMTTTQKNAITSPAAGLVVYDTTDNKHYGYDGTTWNAFY